MPSIFIQFSGAGGRVLQLQGKETGRVIGIGCIDKEKVKRVLSLCQMVLAVRGSALAGLFVGVLIPHISMTRGDW